MEMPRHEGAADCRIIVLRCVIHTAQHFFIDKIIGESAGKRGDL